MTELTKPGDLLTESGKILAEPAKLLTARPLRVRCECGYVGRIPRLPFGCSCGRRLTTAEDVGDEPEAPPRLVTLAPRPPAKGFGPGAELQRLLESIGAFLHRFLPFTRRWRLNHLDCGCGNFVAIMDEWGPAGCREWFWTIVGWLEQSAEKQAWIRPLAPARGGFVKRRLQICLSRAQHTATRLVAAWVLEISIRRAESNSAAEETAPPSPA